MKIAAIIQARTSSTRLSKKVLRELPYASGITVLEQVIRRLKKAKRLKQIIVATTAQKRDNPIVKIAKKEKVSYFRGSKNNVLSRYYLAALKNKVDIIIRVCSDSPCIDPGLVDRLLDKHVRTKADFSIINRSLPHGFDVEIINFCALKKAYKNAKKEYEKEHVTPYISNNPSIFRIAQMNVPRWLAISNSRLTLDTEEDYALLCVLFDYLYPRNKYFGVKEIIDLFNQKPWLKLINKKIIQKKIFHSLKDELKASIIFLNLQDLRRAADFIKVRLLK